MSVTPYSLGQTPGDYPGNANYPMRMLMEAVAPYKRRSPWTGGKLLDQNGVGQCVGASGREWLTSSPVLYKAPHPSMEESYLGAKQNDGFGDPTPDRGSNSDGLMKYYQLLGLVDSYWWTDTVDEAQEYVLTRGPILLGTPWDNSCFYPDKNGQIHPDGNEVGGHELLIEWFYKSTKLFLVRNHWVNGDGTPWGNVYHHPGYCTIHRDDLESLVNRGADLCAAIEHPL